MARKGRRRAQGARQSAADRDRLARIRVADDVWTDFRAAAGDVPLGVVLGGLVEREVERYRARRARQGTLRDEELVDALERARELYDQVAATIAGIERRLDRPRGGQGRP